MVFMPNITTNHAITYTNSGQFGFTDAITTGSLLTHARTPLYLLKERDQEVNHIIIKFKLS